MVKFLCTENVSFCICIPSIFVFVLVFAFIFVFVFEFVFPFCWRSYEMSKLLELVGNCGQIFVRGKISSTFLSSSGRQGNESTTRIETNLFSKCVVICCYQIIKRKTTNKATAKSMLCE